MPRIREYQVRDQVAGPVERRRASAEDIGFGEGLKTLGRGISQAGDALTRRAEQDEISDLNRRFAENQATSSEDLQETLRTADPGDKNITNDFLERYDERTDEIGSNLSTAAGRNYYARTRAAQRVQFLRSAAAGQADLAGIKAKTDYVNSLNSYSSSLINDPSSFEFTNQMHTEALNQMVEAGNLSKADALKLKTSGQTDLAKSAVRGWIQNDPNFAKEQLNQGRWDNYVDGDLKRQLLGESDQAIRGQEIEDRRRQQQQEEALKAQQIQTQNDLLNGINAGSVSAKDILNSNLNPTGSGSKKQFLDMLNKRVSKGGGGQTDPGTFRTLFDRIHADDEDPKKILDENELNSYLGRGLSFTDLNRLRGEIQGRKTQSGAIEAELKKNVSNIAKSVLTKSDPVTGLKDPEGDTQYQRFMNYFLTEYDRLRKEGKSPQELLNPDSKDYIGVAVRDYAKSPQQILEAIGRRIQGEQLQQQGPVTPKGEPDFNNMSEDQLKEYINAQ